MSRIDCSQLLSLILDSESHLTPSGLAKQAADLPGFSKAGVKACLKELVESGEVVYGYDFGSTHIVPSFMKPVAVTRHVVLRPPNITFKPLENHEGSGIRPIDVVLRPGISFGSGSHPTTRLCLGALDYCFNEMEGKKVALGSCLDVGCGSGVLGIAAVKFGADSCLALDLDTVSLVEAEKNVQENGLEQQIRVSDESVESLEGEFSLIIANLRAPTLMRLASVFKALASEDALVVLSGFRPHEGERLLDAYHGLGFCSIRQKNEKSWAGALLSIGG